MPKPLHDLDTINTEYIECRALMHGWEEIPYDGEAPHRWRHLSARASATILLFRCWRCGTKRYDVWGTRTGDLIERAYRTPDGYSLPKGHGRKVLVRAAYLNRTLRPSSNGKKR